MNIQDFYTGHAFDAYEFFGAHTYFGGTHFAVWAPSAQHIAVETEIGTFDLHRTQSAVWECDAPGVQAGMVYQYWVRGANGQSVAHCDPYGTAMTLRPDGRSIVSDAPKSFSDDKWMQERTKCFDKPLNIYEVHAGSWRQKEDGSWYTYAELADLLPAYCKKNGFTHIEFMPLAEHPFDGSWGYQTTGYFAVTSRYGTPAQFASFVNACHRMGIGVIMDFVPVHFAANADALANFDGTHLYEYDSDVGHSEWGTCNFNYYRREVCSFLNSAAALWMEVYHCDGIRMDAISRALYWQGAPARGVNEGAVTFLRNLNHGLNDRWPTGVYMAEDSTNFLKVTAPTRYDGIGFDYKWDMGWMHDTLDYFATPFGQRPDAYGKIIFSMHYFYNELYLLALSHDEVVHGKKTVIDKLWGTYEEKCAQLRTLYFYMYAHPGKKLNFMGNELGHFREWDEKRELDWDLLKYPFHDAFQKYFGALSRLYATQPALYAGEYDPRCFEWVASESRDEGVYAWLRKGAGQTILCVMNTQNTAHKKFPLYLSFPAGAEELLNTEAPCWGGADKSKPKALHTSDGGVYGRDYTLTVDLPAMGSRMFRLTPEAPRPEAAQASARRAAAARRKAARTQNAKADAAAYNSKK